MFSTARAATLILLASILLCALPAGGCRSVMPSGRSADGPFTAEYTFRNVREMTGLNEWLLIKGVLMRHAAGALDVRRSEARAVDDVTLRDYTAKFAVTGFDKLGAIQKDLDKLVQQEFKSRPGRTEQIDLRIRDATVAYAGNFVSATIEIRVRGVTEPGASVVIFGGADETPSTVRVDPRGYWTSLISIRRDQDYVYGYSQSGDTRKFFRVHVFDQREEPLTEAEFPQKLLDQR